MAMKRGMPAKTVFSTRGLSAPRQVVRNRLEPAAKFWLNESPHVLVASESMNENHAFVALAVHMDIVTLANGHDSPFLLPMPRVVWNLLPNAHGLRTPFILYPPARRSGLVRLTEIRKNEPTFTASDCIPNIYPTARIGRELGSSPQAENISTRSLMHQEGPLEVEPR